MLTKKFRYFVGDFETTVFNGQTYTEVWASACVELYTENVHIFHSIDEQFDYLADLPEHICIYYHNLKFDGSFWLSFLLTVKGLKQAYYTGKDSKDIHWYEEKQMANNTFKYSISAMGQWYSIIIKINNKFIEIRDSLKLLPFSVKRIGNAFKTNHKKLDMEYAGFRYAGCYITDEEKEYIRNDVLVIKEALEIMFEEGHNSLTIGACCLKEFKRNIETKEYAANFPDLTVFDIPNKEQNIDSWIRQSYRGGWCYVVKGKEHKIFNNGITADVNSLYPSMMSSESGNRFPVGLPTFWFGNYIPDIAQQSDKYFFVKIKTRFYIKDGYLPFIQVKRNLLYRANECLETSDIVDTDGVAKPYYLDLNGEVKDTRLELTLTMTDYKLFIDHYNVVDFEIIEGCYFETEIGLFDNYMNRYKKIKLNSKGAKRELAKLFLNNLDGKMASSDDSSFKVAYVKSDNSIGFETVRENNKKVGYIPIGSAITSYARNFTIRTAQKNYHGVNKRGFIYADTDSIHCDLNPEELIDVKIDPVNFCCWKLEAYWDEGIFTRQKTYIEHITHEDGDPVDKPYYNIKCAGMPDKCKILLNFSLTGCPTNAWDKLNETEKEFVSKKRTLKDFDVGLCVPSKLLPKRIKGGIVLTETNYEMR